MMNSQTTTQQLQEYVLDLLPDAEKTQLAQQIAADPSLLPQVQAERRVGQLVKITLQQATSVENGRLVQLMPAIPKRKSLVWLGFGFAPRQVAMVAMLFLLVLGGWQWLTGNVPSINSTEATIVAVTATMTHTPTATETQTVENEAAETAVSSQPEPPIIILTPAPTPVAAVPLNAN